MGGFEKAYAGSTYLTLIGFLVLVITSLYILFGKEKYILIPFLAMICLIPNSQRIVIAGIDLSLFRILVLVGWVRIILKKEYLNFYWNAIDILALWYFITHLVTYVLREREIVYVLGISVEMVGLYFVVRILMDKSSVLNGVKFLGIISIPISLSMLYEHLTQINPFFYVGGVPLFSVMREGDVRAKGAFSHPISAGAFWASCFPLFIGVKNYLKNKKSYIIYAACALLCIYSVGSSTPIMSLLAGIGYLFLFKVRNKLSFIKASIVISLIILQMSMNRPIWFLISMVDVAGGSTGWFRAVLIDEFIRHMPDWFFIGVHNTYYWGAGHNFASAGLADTANQYVAEGAFFGMSGFIVFILLYVKQLSFLEDLSFEKNKDYNSFFYWCFSASVIVHLFNFIGVAYFDQLRSFLWAEIAMINILYISVYPKKLDPVITNS